MKTAILTFSLVLFSAFLLLLAKPTAAYASASLSLSPATATKNVNDTFAVDIILDTGGDAVSGATALLNFDATQLRVNDDDANTAGIQIANGPIFNQVLANTVDNSAGTIRFDAGGLGGAGYTGHGTMATIHFKALAAGTAQVSFTFDPNSTTDTSQVAAASGPTNLLTTVNNGTYTINTSGSTTTPTTLPSTGALEDTIMLLVGGLGLFAVGFFLARRTLL